MNTPIEHIATLVIGTVEFVAPFEIKVLLDSEAPQATALNTGVPTGFPRINGYVLIPNETGAVVGLITWLGVERSAFPKRMGLKDFGLIDLPFPQRKLALAPLGTLLRTGNRQGGYYRLQRGISAFPSVGDPVLLPTAEQLRSIVEAADPEDQRVQIGISPLASNAKVTIDPNKLFGRHLAVLGNTGSGKSCSVAGLIRWSLAAAQEAATEPVNARFIVLDPNGEYSQAFADVTTARIFRALPRETGSKPLIVPAWMWNSQEWTAFAHAAPGVQRPLLLRALRELRSGAQVDEPIERSSKRVFGFYVTSVRSRIAQGPAGYAEFPNNLHFGDFLRNVATDAARYAGLTAGSLRTNLNALVDATTDVADARYWETANKSGYNDFSETDLIKVADQLDKVVGTLGDSPQLGSISEDAPVEFEVDALADHLDRLANEAGGGQVAQFVATLQMRIQLMLADARLGAVINPEDNISLSFAQWLEEYIGKDAASNGQLAILDLSLVSSDVLHIVIAVVGRVIFEATQRYRRLTGNELPTVLVLEEAHNFIRRSEYVEEGYTTATQMCRQTFERIAREGRKFGLGLVLSSQRPSELSPTVLAQCNTFLLHRLVNDQDQQLVSKLVPDNLGGLLRELPSLPLRQAILLGGATPMPVLVEINELSASQCPKSSDPKFWEVWTGTERRPIDWTHIASEWTGIAPEQPPGNQAT